MQHPRQAKVLHVRHATGDLRRDVDAWQRLADDRVRRRILELRYRFRAHFGIALRHELAEGDADAAVANDLAVLRLQAIRRNVIERVEGMTGLEVVEVNVAVDDVYLGEDDDDSDEPARVQ